MSPTNEMTLAKAFRDAGIEQEKAERLAETIFGAIRDNVATKADVERARTDLHAEIILVQRDLRELEQRFDLKLERLERRLTFGGLAALATGLGALFAALQLLAAAHDALSRSRYVARETFPLALTSAQD